MHSMTIWRRFSVAFSDVTCGIDGRPRFVDPSLAWNDPNLERVTKNDWTDDACPADCAYQDYQYPGDSRTLADWAPAL